MLHESLIEILPDGVLLLDVETERFILANLAAEQLFGRSRAELTGLGMRDLARPWDLARLELMRAALDASGVWNGELWLLRADGTYAPTDVAARAWTADGRQLLQLCCRDASQRWREQALRQLVDHAADRLASAADYDETVRAVVTMALPGIADVALLQLDGTTGFDALALLAHVDHDRPGAPPVVVDAGLAVDAREAARSGKTLMIPLAVNGQELGTLTLRRTDDRHWDPADRPLIDELAYHAAQAIDQSRRWVVARRELAQRTALLRIARALDSADSPKQVLRVLLDEAIRTAGAEDGGVAWWDESQGALVQVLSPLGVANGTALDARRSLVGLAATERRPQIENDYQGRFGAGTPAGKAGARTVLAAPLVHDGRLLGAISVSNLSASRAFHAEDAWTMELLASAAAMTLVGIERARVVGATLAMTDASRLVDGDLATSLGEARRGMERAAGHLARLQHLIQAETGTGPFGLRRDFGLPPTAAAGLPHLQATSVPPPALESPMLDGSSASSAAST